MPNVYVCNHCSTSVTTNSSPEIRGCPANPGLHVEYHSWNKIGEVSYAAENTHAHAVQADRGSPSYDNFGMGQLFLVVLITLAIFDVAIKLFFGTFAHTFLFAALGPLFYNIYLVLTGHP